MTEATSRLNKSVQAIEDAQTEIRELMKNAYLLGMTRIQIEVALNDVIKRAVRNIHIPRLKRDTILSLKNFAYRQQGIWLSIGVSPALLLFLGGGSKQQPPQPLSRELTAITGIVPSAFNTGVPLSRYYNDVWKTKVQPVLDELVKAKALDPNDYSGRNSLRNLAEMEVRYQDHKDKVTELKADGVKIVACSSHADCSERCAPYQGRLYSLDGTTGTIDGYKYVPLEEATQNPRDRYVTKAGRVYQNGLLGFNCFDDKTEVYTNRGWRLFKDLDRTEQFLTLNTETNQTEYKYAYAWFISCYWGDMIHISDDKISLNVTPNHQVLTWSKWRNKFVFKAANRIRPTDIIPTEDGLDWGKKNVWQEFFYSGYVYCVSVPNHTLLVRRENKVVWCGNCRHHLEEYKGKLLPQVSAKERKKEYKITKTQRRLEAETRQEKARALMLKGVKPEEYKKARNRAKALYMKYETFCRKNNRVIYKMRTDI